MRTRALFWSCLAASAVFAVACSSPLAMPEAKASIIASWGEATEAEAAAVVTVRVSVAEGLAVESFGLTVKVASAAREYWRTELFQERIPSGASAVVEIRLRFADSEERYVGGSAVIDGTWFE